jgi:hypothetical protein
MTLTVKPRADRVPSQPHRGLVDHVTDLPAFAKNGNPWRLSQSDATAAHRDSVIVRTVLSVRPKTAYANWYGVREVGMV